MLYVPMEPFTTLATRKMYETPFVNPVTVADVLVEFVLLENCVHVDPELDEYWMAYPVGAAGTCTLASSNELLISWVKPFDVAVASAMVALDEPIHVADWPFWVAVPPVIRQFELAVKLTDANCVAPFVIKRVPAAHRALLPISTSK